MALRGVVIPSLLLTVVMTAAAQPAQFEVASIKPATETKHGLWYTGSRVQILGLTVHELIAAAWRLREYQVSGPSSIDSTRFEIEAKLPSESARLADSAKSAQIWLMTQTLLAELQHRRDARTWPVNRPQRADAAVLRHIELYR